MLACRLSCLLPVLLAPRLVLAAPQPTVLHHEDFSRDGADTWPEEWLTSGGSWQLLGGTNPVARQSDPKLRGTAWAALTWVNYRLRATATCREHQSPWGMGVFAYWQDAGNYYRLSNFGKQLQLVRCLDGVAEVLAASPLAIEPNHPWSFELALDVVGNATRLRGRAWPAGESPPAGWAVEAQDFSKIRRGGAAGLWCAKARCQFDDLEIVPTDPSRAGNSGNTYRATFEEGVVGQPPAGWFALGGEWVIAGDDNRVLEQRQKQPPLTFDANAFCLVAEWTNYTASAQMRCLTGRENWGFGIAGYYQNENNHYRLYSVGSTLFLGRRQADVGTTLMAQTPYPFVEKRLYELKLQLVSRADKTVLRGKAWPVDEPEPAEWLLEAEDASSRRFTAGAVALVAVEAACEFDEVTVVKNADAAGNSEADKR